MGQYVSVPGNAASGFSVCDHPTTFVWEGETLAIGQVLREWREPGAKHYLVSTADSRQFRLIFHETSGRWSALEVTITQTHYFSRRVA